MLIGETIRVALASIRANKLRALLTMLGVIIGVAAVITVVAMGTGAQKAVEDRINSMGANLVQVMGGQQMMRGIAGANRAPMTVDDYEAVQRDVQSIERVVPEMENGQQVQLGNTNIRSSIVGTTAEYPVARNYTITSGRMFTSGEDAARKLYAVVGADVPKMLNVNDASIIGQEILIRKLRFEVIGVLSPKGAESYRNPNEQILIPLTTARYRVFGNDRIGSMAVIVRDGVSMERSIVEIERVMRREHKIRVGASNDFMIVTPKEFLATQQQTSETFSMLLLAIAGVSLLVGGIGIMNIMLVSVTERTKEIGIRKSLGATKMTIMGQFLIEALVLCLAGGLVGILLGWGASAVVAQKLGWNTVVSPVAVGVAFAFSALVGLFFGLWPARRAAGLDPIQALRYE
jgi:putative ABC transport system permease protein